MINSDQGAESAASTTQYQARCEKCGATTQLDTGVCVSCLLREGLETGGDVSKTLYETVLDELDARDKPWQLGNYEILEQIGCGGMGVIYSFWIPNLHGKKDAFPDHDTAIWLRADKEG